MCDFPLNMQEQCKLSVNWDIPCSQKHWTERSVLGSFCDPGEHVEVCKLEYIPFDPVGAPCETCLRACKTGVPRWCTGPGGGGYSMYGRTGTYNGMYHRCTLYYGISPPGVPVLRDIPPVVPCKALPGTHDPVRHCLVPYGHPGSSTSL